MSIRPATKIDLPLIATLVRELAEYEKLADQAVATEDDFDRALFAPSPRAYALIVEQDGQAAGFAFYFYNFSTFLGRSGIYVEDVFIRPQFRRNGFGQAIFKYLAKNARLRWLARSAHGLS